ncbi:Lipase A [Penicillium oxalicum]|uniref:Lipase A n=1 Tax=Penicillium oxalicum TaxID=69781 RepID=UPI0020B8533D|nr:Lipase A [Penicillium oxalicum]KAI2788520.1 Lipase A [Penicillium oxalicum]
MLHLKSLSLSCVIAWLLGSSGAEAGAAVTRETSPVSNKLFNSLEELSRLVDISYCVGTTGVKKPFQCLSHCAEFPNLELIETWNTGILLSDSCGYIALSHPPGPKRIVVAFRGTYSITNTIIDLSAYPQSYIPYNGHEDEDENKKHSNKDNNQDKLDNHSQTNYDTSQIQKQSNPETQTIRCNNCTVHAGFMKSWLHTRSAILPTVFHAIQQYPDYEITLVGHSLGGAVATLAGLEMRLKGWNPLITTFGAPMVGNAAFATFLDKTFHIGNYTRAGQNVEDQRIRRVTHIEDPVPLLPLREWGYAPHAAEIFIAKAALPPGPEDVRICEGDEDTRCIAGAGMSANSLQDGLLDVVISAESENAAMDNTCLSDVEDADSKLRGASDAQQVILSKHQRRRKGQCETLVQEKTAPLYPRSWNWDVIPARYRLWELFFAHRDYFWRIGLCMPSGNLFE